MISSNSKDKALLIQLKMNSGSASQVSLARSILEQPPTDKVQSLREVSITILDKIRY